MLVAALAVAGFTAGVAGAWSPCGFSAVESIGAAESRRSLAASGALFAVGALAGGAATFVGLAALGSALPHAVVAAVGVALAAAAAEAAGVRILPQVRRQVPESWRRVLPLPLAALGYGMLLGLGFVTFVFTLAFWALATIALLLGQVRFGLALGLGFGLGRALPIVALAPLARRRIGRELVDAMAMRPVILRTVRLAAALALVACALALLAGRASAAVVAHGVTDPSADVGLVAWDTGGGSALLYSIGALGGAADAHHAGPLRAPVRGRNAAVGGGNLAWRRGDVVHVVRTSDFSPVSDTAIRGVSALAVSSRWLVVRAGSGGSDRLVARSLATGRARTIATAASPRLGRPSLSGDRLVYHVATPRVSRIVLFDLAQGIRRVVRKSRFVQLTNPSLADGWLLYVRASSLRQRLVRGPLGQPGGDRTLLEKGPTAAHDLGYEPGYSHTTRTPHTHRTDSMLWTTALTPGSAYLTLYSVRRGRAGSRIVHVAAGKPHPQPKPSGSLSVEQPALAPALVYTASERAQDSLVGITPGGAEEVLATAPRLEDPSWSRDGARLAFAGPGGIFVWTVVGGQPVRVTSGGADSDPAWSPSGSSLAFVRNGVVYTVGPDGRQPHRVTPLSARSEEPAWSPDGSRIAFSSRRRGNWDIYAVDTAGSERRLTTGPASEGFPAWSPDGRRLTFDRRTASGLRVFVLDLGDGSVRRVTGGPGDDLHATWSQDGSRIAFVSDRDGRPRIWVAPTSGGQAEALGVAGGIEDAPAWLPVAAPARHP